jgi:chromosome segregation ATPase
MVEANGGDDRGLRTGGELNMAPKLGDDIAGQLEQTREELGQTREELKETREELRHVREQMSELEHTTGRDGANRRDESSPGDTAPRVDEGAEGLDIGREP